MSAQQILKALQSLRPAAEYNLRSNDLSGLEWLDQAQPRPTDDEINAAIAAAAAAPQGAFVARDLIAQLTPGDTAAILNAVSASPGMALLWYSLLAQGQAPIELSSARFQNGWAALTQVLGADRCAALATALNIVPPAAG